MLSLASALALVAVSAPGLAAAEATAGPPWISIELPANPHDRTTRGAYLLVHAFHHGTPTGFPVTGVAEGLVNGKRRTVPLKVRETSRTGVYAVDRQWDDEGEWTLVITVAQGQDDVAQAMVQISGGQVFSVTVPVTKQDSWNIPRKITRAEIEASLTDRPASMKRGR
jgi:hypothetical protein